MRYFSIPFVYLVLVALAGCGSGDVPRTKVSGKVTHAGKGPLPGGTIQFVLASNPNYAGGAQIDPDGKYTVHDAPVGECKVLVDNLYLKPGGGAPPMLPGKTPAKKPNKKIEVPKEVEKTPGGDANPGKYVVLEGTYASAESTPLKVTLSSGSNEKDFDVK